MTSRPPTPDPASEEEPVAAAHGAGEKPPPAKKKRRVGRIVFWLLFVSLLLSAAWGGWEWQKFMQRPLAEAVTLEIDRGWPLARIAETLEQKGVVSSAHWFILLTRWTRLRISREGVEQGPGIQAGEYAFPVGETPEQVLARMISGNQVVHRLAIPEGATVAEIGVKMQIQGWSQAKTLLMDAETPKRLGLEATSLEGWLFPSTYHYRRHDTALEVLGRMVKLSQQVVHEQWQAREREGAGRAVRLSLPEVLVLASIIEKETGQAQERPRIAAVFHNRLRKKMRLQSDPTVIYGLQRHLGGPGFDGNLTKQHLRDPTPYNTYTQYGLPPTPICNPGKASIQAALHPEDVEDLYFVARGDGFHVFSKTLKEHEANVDRYQRQPAARKK
ncbi:MAG: endolytic transglycosylase MltG [Magnetococcus sp. XQGC-1]